VSGEALAVGDKASEVTVTDGPGSSFDLLGDTAGKVRLVSVVPGAD